MIRSHACNMAEAGTVHVQSGNKRTPLPGSWFSRRYNTARVCVSSRSALLILLWSFVLGLWNGMALNPDLYLRSFVIIFTLASYGFVAMVTCFFPLAGILADVRYGRYKTVVRSVFLVLITEPLVAVVGIAISLVLISDLKYVVFVWFEVFLSVVGFVIFTASCISLVIFTANVIQFGMDQLHDSPGEDRTLFIHWYVWVYYLSIFIGQLAWNLALYVPYNTTYNSYYNIIGYCMLGFIPVSALVILPATLCLARRRRQWFLIEPGQYNPYKLVYRITKFARQHKVPMRRSAFTYCEDELPAGLDLAKEKYGGEFTTEQVEDVKVFYGILKILFSFGAVFFMDFAASSVLPMYALHTTAFYTGSDYLHMFNGTLVEDILLKSGLLSPLLTVVCIPVYLCLLRPFISRFVPGMLKRMGLAMLLTLLSLVVSFTMDTVAHMQHRNTTACMFQITIDIDYTDIPQPALQTSLLLIIQLTLSALSHMLIYIAIFEFICSQAPHPMKGLLIGLFYAIKGLNQSLAALLVVPIIGMEVKHFLFPISCGFFYYLVNILLGAIAVLIFVWAAKTYRYRERDEPSNIHRYAEEYYSNPQQEQYYDYD